MRRFNVGDEVYARPDKDAIGTFAELIAINEADVALKPRSLSMEEAASIPLVGLTAWQALVERANVQHGQNVFIQAGSGGVGTFAIQLAKHLGATVATTTSAENVELVEGLGADIVIDYKTQDFEASLDNYDVVLHSQNGTTLEKSLRVLKPGGRLISISGPPDPAFGGDIGAPWFVKAILRAGSSTTRRRAKRLQVDYSFLFMRANGTQLTEITALIDSGIIRPILDRVSAFASTHEAIAYVESGRAKGKVRGDDAMTWVTDFDRTTTVIPVEARPGEFLVDLDAGWSSLVGVHGGYMCALAVCGAESMASGRVVRTMSTSFLRSARVGPAELSVREVRRGRSITTMVAELAQDQHVLSVSRLTLMTERSGLEWSEPRPVDLPPPADCVPFTPPAHAVNFGRFEMRFDPERMPFAGERAHVAGYVRPLEARPIDAAWLVMAADCFPPPAFARIEPPTGGMSIDLTVHIHRSGLCLGEGAWLAGSFEIDDSTGGLAVEHGRITRLDGTVLAESLQTRLTAQG